MRSRFLFFASWADRAHTTPSVGEQMIAMLMLGLGLFVCCEATCTVASCDQYMRQMADTFVCENDESCRHEMERHFQAITPSDSESVNGRLRDSFRVLFASCRNDTECTRPEVSLLWL